MSKLVRNALMKRSAPPGPPTVNVLAGLPSSSFYKEGYGWLWEPSRINNGVMLNEGGAGIVATAFYGTSGAGAANNNWCGFEVRLPSAKAVKRMMVSCYRKGETSDHDFLIEAKVAGSFTPVSQQPNYFPVGRPYEYQVFDFNASGAVVSDAWRVRIVNWADNVVSNIYLGEVQLLADA